MVKITNSNQFCKLVEELEKNPALARGFTRKTVPVNYKQQWKDIGIKLNELGPPLRDYESWQKVWRDLKFKVRRKIANNKAKCPATERDRYKPAELSSLEEKVATLVQFEKQLDQKDVSSHYVSSEEDEPVKTLKKVKTEETELEKVHQSASKKENQLGQISEEVKVNEEIAEDIVYKFFQPEEDISIQNTDDESEHSRRRRGKNPPEDQRQNLHENHIPIQERLVSKLSASLTSIQTSLADTAYYQRKILENEQRKIQIMERQQEREEEIYEYEKKLKRVQLEIKVRELELLDRSLKRKN